MNFLIGLLPSKPGINRTSTALLDTAFSAIPVMIGGYGNSTKKKKKKKSIFTFVIYRGGDTITGKP